MTALVAVVVYHALLGVALAAFVWVVGVGLLPRSDVREHMLDAYAVGLLATTAAAALVLLHPAGWLAAAALVFAIVRAGLRVRGLPASGGRALAWAVVPAVAFACILGLLLHGPTDELDSAAFGDMLFYVDKLVSAAQSIVPYRDLLVEGESLVYVESAPSFISAALSPLGLDPVLVQAALFPAFLVAALAIGIGIARPDGLPLAGALLAAGAITYPSWVTETPPAALALPLAFPLYGHLVAPRRPAVLAIVAAVVAVDLLLTKVLGLVAGAVVLAAILLARSGRTGRDRLLRVALPLAIAGALAVAALVLLVPWQASLAEAKVLPLEAVERLDELSADAFAPAATILAQVLVVAAFAAAALWTPAAAVAAALVGFWFAHRYNFDIAVGMGVLVGALLVRRSTPLLLVAGGALLVSAWLRELVGLNAGFALLAVALAALATRSRRALAGAAAVAVVLALIVGGGRLRPFHATLTTEDYEIWERVAEAVPRDGLVFTSLTGPRIAPYEGWHNYPSIAGRQLYLAGWYDGRLVADEAERERRLRINRAVVSGARAPDSVPTDRTFGSYWLVIARADSPPRGVRLVYANDRFELYRFTTASTLR